MDVMRLNWDATLRYCEQLAGMAKAFRPDMIVGLSRGGLVPARVLADIMAVHDIGILGVSFYKGMGMTADFPRITQELTEDLKGKRILIVDDVADTGRSLLVAKDYLERKGASEIRVATLHFKPTSEFKPDFFVETTTAWIAYPWEKNEIDRELAKEGKE
jgi:uncharacterized protein